MSKIRTWYGVKRPYHVIYMVWVVILSHTVLCEIGIKRLIPCVLYNVVWAYHVCCTTSMNNVVWVPLYIIGDHTIPRSI